MKKIARATLLVIAGLVLSTGIASASVYSNYRGENPCLFGLSNLKSHGYSENAAYTTDGIHQLLNNIDVKAYNVDTLAPGQQYQLIYSCYVDHQLAHATLQAVPVNNPGHPITNIYWTFTKPTF